MENWFKQDRSRISRFVKVATQHVFDHFHHTLAFDEERLKLNLVAYAACIAWQLGLRDRDYILAFIIALFVDGKFFYVAAPIFGYVDFVEPQTA